MSDINDVVKSARKFASSTKDEAISIIVNSLCEIIVGLQKQLQQRKKNDD